MVNKLHVHIIANETVITIIVILLLLLLLLLPLSQSTAVLCILENEKFFKLKNEGYKKKGEKIGMALHIWYCSLWNVSHHTSR